MLKMSEINKLDASAINQRVSELRKELFDLRLQKAQLLLKSLTF
jgi:ribosomal protein L29